MSGKLLEESERKSDMADKILEEWKRQYEKEDKKLREWEKQVEKEEGKIREWEKQVEEREGKLREWERQAKEEEEKTGEGKGQAKEAEEKTGERGIQAEKADEESEKWNRKTEQTADGEKQDYSGRKRRKDRHLTGSLAAKVAAFFLLAGSFLVGVGATAVFIAMAEYGFFTESLNTVLMNVPWRESSNVVDDNFRTTAEFVFFLQEYRVSIFCLGLGGILLFLVCFIFLMSSAGHRNGYKGIVPGVLTRMPLDVLTFLFGGTAMVFTYIVRDFIPYGSYCKKIALWGLWGIVMVVWMTIFFMDFALRLKLGKCWKHTLIYSLLRGIWCLVRFLGRAAGTIVRGIAAIAQGVPAVFTTLIGFFGIFMAEFLGLAALCRTFLEDGFLLWFLVKVVLLAVIMYIALTCKRLLAASRALAEGREDYKVDTSRMFGDFSEHGENLNSLGEGISKAVAERMRSEHLKTELITNVSHDIKTPLTSIINYADLIYEESAQAMENADTQGADDIRTGQGADAGEGANAGQGTEGGDTPMGKIKEYSQILLRQSRRMKKLLEDLVEASKATTGNLEVNLEPCEAGVLLSQAVGEYQQKMEEKKLDLIARQPEEPVKIMADGRHLWRVFDNLLNNICKYAQENTRVYLSLELREGHVLIIFRNMSKYPLDISGEELEERFVRGDRSRHMEGNGLGLTIAKSLVELQKGRMEIVIDGDLFKVVLSFPQVIAP